MKIESQIPAEWQARPIDVKSGWKNNAKLLAEITTAVNDEIYIEDENVFMEKVDVILEWMKKRYKIEALPK